MLKGLWAAGSLFAAAELVGAAISLLAATAADAIPGIEGFPFKFDLNNTAAVGVLAWYAWHTASRTIPQIIADSRQEVMALTNKFVQELAANRASYEGMADRDRIYHNDQMEKLRERVHEQANFAQQMALKTQEQHMQIVKAVDELHDVTESMKTIFAKMRPAT